MTPSWWLADRRYDDGRWTLAQWPNPAIFVAVLAFAVKWAALSTVGVTVVNEAALYVGRGALLVWGLDELARGVNPLRRVLGIAVLAWQLAEIWGTGFA